MTSFDLKSFAKRAGDSFRKYDPVINNLVETFQRVADAPIFDELGRIATAPYVEAKPDFERFFAVANNPNFSYSDSVQFNPRYGDWLSIGGARRPGIIEKLPVQYRSLTPSTKKYDIQGDEYGTFENQFTGTGKFTPVGKVSEILSKRAPTVKDLGSGFYDIEGQGVKYFDPFKANEDSGGFSGVDRNNILSLISSGGDVDSGLLNSVYGTDDGYHHWRFAHVRSPAHQAMLDNLDGNYGTKGIRMFSNALAQQLGVDPEVFDRVAGQKFADLLKEGKYSVSDQGGMNQIADAVFAKAQELTGRELPENLRQQVYDYNGQVRGLWDVPHPKKSGFAKQVAGDIAGGALSLGGALLKPVGLEDYAAPIIGAGITYATGGAGAGILGAVGSAALGGATAAALPAVANQDFSGALKGAALGGAAGAIGGYAAGYNPVTNLGPQGNLIANQAVQGGLSGAAGGLLTGQDPIKAGLLGAAVSGGTTALSTGIQAVGNAIDDAGKTTQVVGGIDDSRFDLGKSAPSLMTPPTGVFNQSSASSLAEQIAKMSGTDLSGTAFGSMDSRFTDPASGGTAVQGGGLTTGSTNGLGVTSGFISTPSVGFTSSTRDFDPLNYDRMISGISGTDLTGSNFGGGITQNTPGALGEGVTQTTPVATSRPITSQTSDELARRIIGGLLGGGALAAGAGLLSDGGNDVAGGGVPSRPLQQFQLSPTTNQYGGDFASYGERGSGGFRFYNAPLGLLG